MKKLQKFWHQWKRWNFFGLQLPSLIALLLSIFLLIHISFEICGIVREAIQIKCVGHPTTMECGRASLLSVALTILENTIVVVGSDTVRNLSLLLAASIGWFFLYWRAKIADQGLTVEWITRAIEQLTHEKLSIRLGGILGLEQIANTHEEEREKIVQILVTRIKELIKLKEESQKPIENRDIEIVFKALANIVKPLENQKRDFLEFIRIDLSGLNFVKIDLSCFPLEMTNLDKTYFLEVNLTDTDFSLSSINNATFDNCKGLARYQIMMANWSKGNSPRGLPREWLLPEENLFLFQEDVD